MVRQRVLQQYPNTREEKRSKPNRLLFHPKRLLRKMWDESRFIYLYCFHTQILWIISIHPLHHQILFCLTMVLNKTCDSRNPSLGHPLILSLASFDHLSYHHSFNINSRQTQPYSTIQISISFMLQVIGFVLVFEFSKHWIHSWTWPKITPQRSKLHFTSWYDHMIFKHPPLCLKNK